MKADIERLLQAAVTASTNAYAPYSKFHVGAALLLEDGSIVTGANFENASYGMALCAEAVAIAKANSDGKLKQIVAIAVAGGPEGKVAGGTEAITPCGRCRQIIKEVADLTDRDLPIYCANAHGYVSFSLSELLPHSFGPASLKS